MRTSIAVRSLATLVAAIAACGKPAARPPSVPASAPSLAGGEATMPPGAPALPATCLTRDPDLVISYQLARIGDELVVCGSSYDHLRGCWTLDPATGAVAARARAPIPGAGFPVKDGCHDGMCSGRPPADDDEWSVKLFALHPDGKRAVLLAGLRVTLFDVASKRVTGSFLLRGADTVAEGQLSNSPAGLWFVGDTIYVRGDDAGPASALFRYDLTGKALGGLWGLYHGGVGVDGASLVLQEDAVSTVQILDGLRARPVRTRTVPRGACTPSDLPEWSADDDDPAQAACLAYLGRHYQPYDGAQLVSDGPDLIGFTGGQLFVLDGKTLAEKRRVDVARCDDGPVEDGAEGDSEND